MALAQLFSIYGQLNSRGGIPEEDEFNGDGETGMGGNDGDQKKSASPGIRSTENGI
jgi:hypothetical protein